MVFGVIRKIGGRIKNLIRNQLIFHGIKKGGGEL